MTMVGILVMGALYFYLTQLTPEAIERKRSEKTRAALIEAREALLGYALQHRERQGAQDADFAGSDDREVYGYLPMPDMGSAQNRNEDLANPACVGEGCAALNVNQVVANRTYIGRLPWRTLGLAPLKDGYGECLWYVVSATHKTPGADPIQAMNWDSLSQLDVVAATGQARMASIATIANSAHRRPIAVVFSPGPAVDGARAQSTSDDVGECGGNYNVADYLELPTADELTASTVDFGAQTNAASGDTSANNKALAVQPYSRSNNLLISGKCPRGEAGVCRELGNDTGLAIDSASFFDRLRRSSYFVSEINTLLNTVVDCLNKNGVSVDAAGFAQPVDKTVGRLPDHSCYDDDKFPLGYFRHWRDQVLLAKPTTGSLQLGAQNCDAIVIFAGQRAGAQVRDTAAARLAPSNYLEGDNLSSFTSTTTGFAGPSLFTATTGAQDIVRCISPSLATPTPVNSTPLNPYGQMTAYNFATQTLTLGRLYSFSTATRTSLMPSLFGCSWSSSVNDLGSGMRSYFRFNILDSGEGFVFATIDADRNDATVCGAARQHLGYSGDNLLTPIVQAPKIGIEFDTTRQGNFNPASANPLNNGRSDPNYTGGHVAIVYWGGESAIVSGSCSASCVAPLYCQAGVCYLKAEEDDNVHGRPTPPDASPRPAPRNPPAPATPGAPPLGVYKLDPGLSQIPLNQDIHVRVELSKQTTDNAAHSTTFLLEVWYLADSATDANRIMAMKNLSGPMRRMYPSFSPHLRDTPTIYDIKEGACAADHTCSGSQTCGDDNICYLPLMRKLRIGFTTAQSTAARDQIIEIKDLTTLALP